MASEISGIILFIVLKREANLIVWKKSRKNQNQNETKNIECLQHPLALEIYKTHKKKSIVKKVNLYNLF